MRAINHAVTGALIGLVVGEPAVAVPAAVISHFVCDAIPHYDDDQTDKSWVKTRRFRNLLVIDAALCIGLVAVLAAGHPVHWLLAAICAFAAAAPDLMWLPRFLLVRQGKKYTQKGFAVFAGRIQWFARPIGAVVEVAWLLGGIVLLAQFLH